MNYFQLACALARAEAHQYTATELERKAVTLRLIATDPISDECPVCHEAAFLCNCDPFDAAEIESRNIDRDNAAEINRESVI